MLPDYVLSARTFAAEKKYDDCAQVLLNGLSENPPMVGPGLGLAYLHQIIPGMIERGLYLEVAHILWGPEVFNAEPESVSLIWNAIRNVVAILVPGAGALGKSYNIAVFFLLDWLEDPIATCIKVVSATREHAKRNVFAHIKTLHRNSSIPLPGTVKDGSIQANEDDKQGIHLVAIPQGDSGAGRLQGFHPVPRKVPHVKYGTLTRVRAVLDEAEEIPQGVWDDVDNMLITVFDLEHIKIAGAANPRDMDSKFGKRCKPKDGWAAFDMETSIEWESELGWKVVRLDGARCENVKQRKVVYPGLLTWEGYKRYLLGGEDSPEFSTMARGAFPQKGMALNAIPRDFMEKAVGQLLFTGPVTYCSSVDLAFEGEDNAVQTVGRFGLAVGYSSRGVTTYFENKSGEREPKYALQVEAQFMLQKNDPAGKLTQTVYISKSVKQNCDNLKIKGFWLIMDRTGNGTGVHDLIRSVEYMGSEVVGVHFGEAASDLKIFGDSTQKASDIYDGLVTELFFAMRNFLEFDFIKFSPSLDISELTEELCSRRFKAGKKIRIESKREYKARGLKSPDKADSATLLVHLVRLKEGFEASMLAISGRTEEVRPGIVDRLEFMSFDS